MTADVIIIGGGLAGLSAAIYLARAQCQTLAIEASLLHMNSIETAGRGRVGVRNVRAAAIADNARQDCVPERVRKCVLVLEDVIGTRERIELERGCGSILRRVVDPHGRGNAVG